MKRYQQLLCMVKVSYFLQLWCKYIQVIAGSHGSSSMELDPTELTQKTLHKSTISSSSGLPSVCAHPRMHYSKLPYYLANRIKSQVLCSSWLNLHRRWLSEKMPHHHKIHLICLHSLKYIVQLSIIQYLKILITFVQLFTCLYQEIFASPQFLHGQKPQFTLCFKISCTLYLICCSDTDWLSYLGILRKVQYKRHSFCTQTNKVL